MTKCQEGAILAVAADPETLWRTLRMQLAASALEVTGEALIFDGRHAAGPHREGETHGP